MSNIIFSVGSHTETEPPGRYFNNPAPPLLKVPNPRTHLLRSLTKIVTECPPQNPWKLSLGGKLQVKGLFAGPTSIAYLFLTLTRTHPDLAILNKDAKHWCTAYLGCGQETLPFTTVDGNPDSHELGIANEFLAYHCVKAAVAQDLGEVDIVLEALANSNVDPALNEIIKGRAGALALLRFLRHWLPESSAKVNTAMKPLINVALENSNPWTFRKEQYLGAIHGDIGILTQIVLCDPSYAPRLEDKLSALLDLQTESGNWPVKDPASGSRVWEFNHLCLGAPGFMFSLTALRPHFPTLETRIDNAVTKGRQCIWKKGILTKRPCLCHGTTGNGLALERGERREHFMALTTEEVMQKSTAEGIYTDEYEEPWGLLWGEAGRAWGWMVLDSEDRGCPAYTDV